MVQRTLSTPANPAMSSDINGHRIPVRMCIGCRQRTEATGLVRLVVRKDVEPPELVVDLAKTMPGRGAWLHPHSDCLALAVRRKAFAPALRVSGLAVSPDDLAESIDEITKKWPNGRNR